MLMASSQRLSGPHMLLVVIQRPLRQKKWLSRCCYVTGDARHQLAATMNPSPAFMGEGASPILESKRKQTA